MHYINVSYDDTFVIGVKKVDSFRITSNDFWNTPFHLREACKYFACWKARKRLKWEWKLNSNLQFSTLQDIKFMVPLDYKFGEHCEAMIILFTHQCHLQMRNKNIDIS